MGNRGSRSVETNHLAVTVCRVVVVVGLVLLVVHGCFGADRGRSCQFYATTSCRKSFVSCCVVVYRVAFCRRRRRRCCCCRGGRGHCSRRSLFRTNKINSRNSPLAGLTCAIFPTFVLGVFSSSCPLALSASIFRSCLLCRWCAIPDHASARPACNTFALFVVTPK